MPLTLDPRTTALVLIDLQNGIAGRQTQPRSAVDVITRANLLLDGFHAANTPVVLVHVMFPVGPLAIRPVADEEMKLPDEAPPGWGDFAPDLHRQDSDIVVLKRQWGAFYGTDLDLQLRRRGISTIVLAGISTSIGVESTARDAFERGYQQVFVEEAMADLHGEAHAAAMKYIFPRMGRVRTAVDVVAALK